MNKEKEVLFSIDGYDVYKNSSYVVKHKPDYNAPSGFQKLGTTKVPSAGVDTSFQCEYNSTHLVWDTGFFEQSPCYSGLDETTRKQRVATLDKGLLKGYKEKMGIKLSDHETLSQKNDNFWQSQNFRLEANTPFDTKDYAQAFALYFALLTRNLCPKGQEGNPRYKNAQFIVVDTNKDMKVKEEKADLEFTAIGSFTHLLKTDKHQLISILKFINVSVTESTTDVALKAIFKDYLEKGADKIIRFNNIVEESLTEEGAAKIEIHNLLKTRLGRDKRIIKNPKGLFSYEGIELGPDLPSSAELIVKLHPEIKKSLLLDDN